ncbi:ran-binding protein 3-like [Hypomesus transpacificus]|uniref:ran-binding protein 3-like n=1 Tax=Hypomesus transpacificus TaxID=137520 RepID=UPI001F07CEAE|nr:ran-binding protein 3-like [Hypomesus transpacificus]
MQLSRNLSEKILCSVTHVESARGAVISYGPEPSPDAGCAEDQAEELKEKTVLSPPVFIFQNTVLSMKRRAERWEERTVGVSPNKRARSFTFPSPRTRNGSCERGSRIRSTSMCFPPPPPVSQSNVFMPPNMCKRTTETASPWMRRSLLRPALLLAPKPWSISQKSHQPEGSHDNLGGLCSVTVNRPPSSLSPPDHRSDIDVSPSDRLQFVFGENMSERVLSPQKTVSGESESDCSSSESDSSSSEPSHNGRVWRSLRESAAAHTASYRRHRPLRRVQLFTGEEKESNVVQMTCILFVLEKGTQSWSERGRGVLRLNDLASGPKGCLQSRIVMRHQGSLKVILNTKLWPHTHLRRPGRRNLQVTATDVDSQAMRVFLVQASVRDVARLYMAIHHRLVALRGGAGAGMEAEGAGAPPREGHCYSENEEEEDEEEEERRRQRREKEKLLHTRLRPVVCDWMHGKPSLGSW